MLKQDREMSNCEPLSQFITIHQKNTSHLHNVQVFLEISITHNMLKGLNTQLGEILNVLLLLNTS